jgi:hypothetical protein
MAFDKNEIWGKASFVDDKNEELGFRKDQCGAWIKKSDYGNRDSIYGWEVDHIKPKTKGGDDNINNLRPLHWKNNLNKSDEKLVCFVTSQGIKNIIK